jgi:hypothetical protein
MLLLQLIQVCETVSHIRDFISRAEVFRKQYSLPNSVSVLYIVEYLTLIFLIQVCDAFTPLIHE